MKQTIILKLFLVILTLQGCSSAPIAPIDSKKWLAGDHHIHSRYSVGWDRSVSPPKPIIAGDAHYSAAMNAQMAYHHGLSWMVITDHGGPNHSKLNLDQAYPDLKASRQAMPNIIQFYGMELDTPGAEHSSLIIPHSHDEAQQLYHLEKSYARNDVYRNQDKGRNTEKRMLAALEDMKSQNKQPIVIVNHPGRTATGLGEYTKVTPTELRNWNDTAPTVAVGMSGSPGHQALTISPDGSIKSNEVRGGYRNYPTMGGFDQMTARLGGFWDSMLGEGRHWWITSSSDSHIHYTEGGADFWPGEFSKTYVYSEKNYDDLLQNIRAGRVFVTTGDLITELYVSVSVDNKNHSASIGDTIEVHAGDTLKVEIKFLDPDRHNAHFDNPKVNRVDLIKGQVMGRLIDKSVDINTTAKVISRFSEKNWRQENGYQVISYTMKNVSKDSYIRIRGTNTTQLEPEKDLKGEDPWSDLWFYSNPIFIKVK